MLDVKRLRVLREVARRGSFSAAAESLGYTQPAISRHVALLERETGTVLLERRPGGVRLTQAGELLVRHADGILARLRYAEDELDALLGMRAGKLRMLTLTSAASTIVPPAVMEFRRRVPEVELSIAMVESQSVLSQLREGEVDLVVSNDEAHLELPDVEGVVLLEEPVMIAVPVDHPLANQGQVTLAQLSEEPWMLAMAQDCPDGRRFGTACRAAGFEPRIAFHNDDYTAVLGFVAAGVGVAPVPEMVFRSNPPGVRALRLTDVELGRSIVALLPAGYHSSVAREMLDVLCQVSKEWQSSPLHAAA